ncbi:Hypothetical protein R9X50_00465400 [Acrodontium crateriforme]|uniref:DUF7605 domain-containing protein n=1 Tax=Acrodontium crateriforme TaxID=150365 RepID=A0AAQ3RAB4_9PEZI|nr:Hypothetical protein R9X50_00465400 [Acrodontium crateriforme]
MSFNAGYGLNSVSTDQAPRLHAYLNDPDTEAEESWMMGASEAADDWCRSNWGKIPGTYAAHCRNWGDHTTTTSKIHRCWNKEIVKPMIHDLEAPWNRHVIEMKAFLETRRDGLEECFEKAMRSIIALKNDVPFDREGFSSVQTLITTLLNRKAMLCTETLGIMNEFQNAVVELGNTSLLSSVRTSFIGKYMKSTYEKAAEANGDGLYQRLKELINGKVKQNPDLFNNIRLQLEDEYRKLTLDAGTKIQASNEKHFRAIRTALDILRTKNAAVEGERNSTFRDRMRKQVLDAQPILRKIEECIAK